MKALIVILSVVCLLGLFAGILFIIQHWPYGQIILDASVGGLALAIFMAIKMRK